MGTIGGITKAVVGGVFVTALVACSGGVSTVGGDGGTTSSSGSSGSSSGSSGSSGSSSGDVGCNVAPMGVTRACVPGTATAGVAISIQAEGDNSCLGCGSSLEPCKVKVEGTKITIGLDVKSCALPEGIACPAVCMQAVATCSIPPLAAGTYTVELAGGVRSSEDPVRQLVVKAGAGESACTIGQGGGRPTIESDDFADSCTLDDDCTLVIEGDLCQPCSCPNEAIAKSALDAYQSKARALQSLCKSGGGSASCVACQEKKARCSGNKCVAATN
jgi:hypothetical protein